MGIKLLWTGMTVMFALDAVFPMPAGRVVGAVLMIIGCILMWLDK